MSLHSTPTADRIHIGIFGKRNAGKSSIINAITGQNLAIVSQVEGTTTDPVYKAMELLPLGPVMVIDTPGLDDEGILGHLRIQKAYQVLNKTDIALLVVDATKGMTKEDDVILRRIKSKEIPHVVVFNKGDLEEKVPVLANTATITVSAAANTNIQELKELIAKQIIEDRHKFPIIQDLVNPYDLVILVVPVDKAAPKGRLILPQQQTIRDLLEANALSLVVKETELAETLNRLKVPPKMVVTDSQVFEAVAEILPKEIPLTSFSMLFARHKGELFTLAEGAKAIDSLKDGDKVLISEGCTHHRQCNDIGTVKLPNWLKNYTKANLEFAVTGGMEFPMDLSPYALVLHCGGCMLNHREMKYRIQCAKDAQVPITNYGIAISLFTGVLERSMAPFKLFLKKENKL